MQNRSKFLTFILSCVPGVGHLYLGLMVRGFTFMVAFFGWITFVVFLCIASGIEDLMILFLVLPVLWFYSFFDALHQRRRIVAGEDVPDISPITELTQGTETGKRSKVWALVFSFVPGAGHMYLGYRDQGLQLMVAFFLGLFVMDWLHMTFMIFIIPIIWFYSMFDALQKASQPVISEPDDFFFVGWLQKNQRLLAYLLIGMGILLIINKFFGRLIPWQYNEYIQTVVVSLLLIGGGIKLLRGTKVQEKQPTCTVENDPEIHHGQSADETEDREEEGHVFREGVILGGMVPVTGALEEEDRSENTDDNIEIREVKPNEGK